MSGYPKFKSPEAAAARFRRCRVKQWWILEDSSNCELICQHCKAMLKDLPPKHPDLSPGYQGNRCIYNPKTKTHVVFHYICSWESIL